MPCVLRKIRVGSPSTPGGSALFTYLPCVSLGMRWWKVSDMQRLHISHSPSHLSPSSPSSSSTTSLRSTTWSTATSWGLAKSWNTTMYVTTSPSSCTRSTVASCQASSSASTASTSAPGCSTFRLIDSSLTTPTFRHLEMISSIISLSSLTTPHARSADSSSSAHVSRQCVMLSSSTAPAKQAKACSAVVRSTPRRAVRIDTARS
mmetsp:Transcript_22880/g.62067  ORF Transcript_22880/g.62067 Transcript_22880/m.62067 type:complete len:205 (-) Transcript_22880:152-766(-)